jgi:hypothetical protein
MERARVMVRDGVEGCAVFSRCFQSVSEDEWKLMRGEVVSTERLAVIGTAPSPHLGWFAFEAVA